MLLYIFFLIYLNARLVLQCNVGKSKKTNLTNVNLQAVSLHGNHHGTLSRLNVKFYVRQEYCTFCINIKTSKLVEIQHILYEINLKSLKLFLPFCLLMLIFQLFHCMVRCPDLKFNFMVDKNNALFCLDVKTFQMVELQKYHNSL